MNATVSPYVDARHVATIVGVSKHSVLQWARNGSMPRPARLGPKGRILRWRADVIDAWLAEHEQTPAQPSDHHEPEALTVH